MDTQATDMGISEKNDRIPEDIIRAIRKTVLEIQLLALNTQIAMRRYAENTDNTNI